MLGFESLQWLSNTYETISHISSCFSFSRKNIQDLAKEGDTDGSEKQKIMEETAAFV